MHDVRELLEIAKADAPAPRLGVDDIVAAGRRRQRWRRGQRLGGFGVAAAAAATAVVLVGGGLVFSNGRPASGTLLGAASPSEPAPTQPAPFPPFRFTFSGYTVDNYQVLEPSQVTPGYQVTSIVDPSTGAFANLIVYQPGAFDPKEFTGGTKVTVQGRDAYLATAQRSRVGGVTQVGGVTTAQTTAPVTVQRLAFQYAMNAWAVIEPQAGPPNVPPIAAAAELKLAERFTVNADAAVTATLPFRPGYLPAGWKLLSATGRSLAKDNDGMVTGVYGAPQQWSFSGLTAPYDLYFSGRTSRVEISVLWVDTPPPDAPKHLPTCGDHFCHRTLPGKTYYVMVQDPAKVLSNAELTKILDGLTFDTIQDNSTWHPVA
jgi:hypothetical protein